MAPSRFTPVPGETTVRSSKDRSPPSQDETPKPAKRFFPQPLETSTKSSKDRPNTPETGDIRSLRKWHVKPDETSSKSSKDNAAKAVTDGKEKPKPRKFAVQPVEESSKSSKDKQPVRKWAPQLMETQQGSRRSKSMDEASSSSRSSSTMKPARKWEPVMIDTATRTRKSGEAQDYKTEQGWQIHAKEHRKHITGSDTPVDDKETDLSQLDQEDRAQSLALPGSSELRRQISPMDGSRRPSSLEQLRTHSYRCPSLDPIESSESELESDASSVSCSPQQPGSPITTSDSNSFNDRINEDKTFKHPTRIRESISEEFSHYLLNLEAKRAQRRMEEQALAAFANSDYHEPVMHYVNSEKDSDDEEELDDRPTTWDGHDEDMIAQMTRRESTAKMPWEQLEMQRHAERLEKQRSAERSREESNSPWWNPFAAAATPAFDSELKSMQDRARPPMLGRDLKFPRCRSPSPARFDVTQGSASLRAQMCYLTESAEAESKRVEEGLWACPGAKRVTSGKGSASSKKDAGKGLWGGFCNAEDTEMPGLTVPVGPSGLMTPAVEGSINPFDQLAGSGVPSGRAPPTPPASLKGSDLGRIDSVLVVEREVDELMEREFPDSFITQVFNYLSLGYPSLARPFDEELSKISRVSMGELRSDDKKAKSSAKGYIRLGDDFEGSGQQEYLQAETCMRWQSLKMYVREWVKQEKNMVKTDAPGGNWGTGARRGSWAI